jgi:hypothetical protein
VDREHQSFFPEPRSDGGQKTTTADFIQELSELAEDHPGGWVEIAGTLVFLEPLDEAMGNPYHDAAGRFTDAAGAMAADKDMGSGVAGSKPKGLPRKVSDGSKLLTGEPLREAVKKAISDLRTKVNKGSAGGYVIDKDSPKLEKWGHQQGRDWVHNEILRPFTKTEGGKSRVAATPGVLHKLSGILALAKTKIAAAETDKKREFWEGVQKTAQHVHDSLSKSAPSAAKSNPFWEKYEKAKGKAKDKMLEDEIERQSSKAFWGDGDKKDKRYASVYSDRAGSYGVEAVSLNQTIGKQESIARDLLDKVEESARLSPTEARKMRETALRCLHAADDAYSGIAAAQMSNAVSNLSAGHSVSASNAELLSSFPPGTPLNFYKLPRGATMAMNLAHAIPFFFVKDGKIVCMGGGRQHTYTGKDVYFSINFEALQK